MDEEETKMRWTIAATLGCLLVGLFVACGPKTDDAPTEASDGSEATELETVVYAGSKWYGHAPVWIGLDRGIFAAAGFEVQDTAFGGSDDRINALENDDAQFASLGQVAMLSAMSRDRRGFYWIGNQDIAPGNEGLVAVGVESVEELRGKKIAVDLNTSVHITTALLLKQAGLDITSDVEVLKADDSAVVDLVRNGDAAAGCIWEPYYAELRGLPGAKVLGDDRDTSIYKEFGTMTGPDMVCASRAWFDADPDRAQRLFRAYFEAVTWCKEHPEELVNFIAAKLDKPRDEVAGAMANFKWLDWEDQQTVMSDAVLFGQAEAAGQVLVDIGTIEAVPAFRDWTRPGLFE